MSNDYRISLIEKLIDSVKSDIGVLKVDIKIHDDQIGFSTVQVAKMKIQKHLKEEELTHWREILLREKDE